LDLTTAQTIRRLYPLTRGRFRRRKLYRSWTDVARAFYLDLVTPDRPLPAAHPPRVVELHARSVQDPVFLRARHSDFMVFSEIFESGEYAPIRKWNLPVDATVIDLGGNVGLSALYFDSVMPKARIVVVEPDHANCAVAARNNARAIGAGRLKLIQAFAAGSDGEAGINRNFRSWAFRMDDTPGAAAERIRCASIPTLLTESGFETVDLLKCDIEGAEADLFRRCDGWIGRVNHLVVETHMPFRNADLYELLRQRGWHPEVLEESQDEKVGLTFLRKGAG
jgi:FkbM family methyltransferase